MLKATGHAAYTDVVIDPNRLLQWPVEGNLLDLAVNIEEPSSVPDPVTTTTEGSSPTAVQGADDALVRDRRR